MKHRELLAKYGTSAILESHTIQEDETTIEGVLLEGMELEQEFTEFLHEEKIEAITEASSRERMILESADLTAEELTSKLDAIIEAADATKMDKFKNFLQRIWIKLQAFTLKVMGKMMGLQKSIATSLEEAAKAAGDLKEEITVKTGDYKVAATAYAQSPTSIKALIDAVASVYKGDSTFSGYNGKDGKEKEAIQAVFEGKSVVDFSGVKTAIKEKVKAWQKVEDRKISSSSVTELNALATKVKELKMDELNKGIKTKMSETLAALKKDVKEDKKNSDAKTKLSNFTQLSSYVQLQQMTAIKAGMNAASYCKAIKKATGKGEKAEATA